MEEVGVDISDRYPNARIDLLQTYCNPSAKALAKPASAEEAIPMVLSRTLAFCCALAHDTRKLLPVRLVRNTKDVRHPLSAR